MNKYMFYMLYILGDEYFNQYTILSLFLIMLQFLALKFIFSNICVAKPVFFLLVFLRYVFF